MRFAHPDAFWLFLPMALLGLLLWRAQAVRARRLLLLADAGLLPSLTRETWPALIKARQLCLMAGLLLCVVAAARPQAGTKVELEKAHGVNVVFALDVSRSMLARDVRPDRLRRAQAEIGELMERLKGNRVGLVAFAGVAYAPCPLTTDISAAKLFLRSLSPDAVPQGGTAIARALATARALFAAERRGDGADKQAGPGAANIVVLVTDGEDHEGDLETEAASVREAGIQLYAVGVGSALGEPIPVGNGEGGTQQYLKDETGQTVLSRLNEPALQKLAQDAGGTYVGGTNGSVGMEQVQVGIAATQKAELESRLVVAYDERFQWVLAPALVLLLTSIALQQRKRTAAGPVRVTP